MAWFWNTNKKTQREIHHVKRYGNSPMYDVTFKGRGPDGGREVRHVNLIYDKDPNILKAIKQWANEEYMNRMIFGMEQIKKMNFKVPKKLKFMMLNRETLETYWVDFDTFMKHVDKLPSK